MTTDIRIIKARSSLVTSQPFYGTLALYLKVVRDDSFDTMATDGEHLWYNEKFLESMSELETKGVIAHEVTHCAYLHHVRRGNRDPELWNVAADYAINRDLLGAGFILPPGCLYDQRFDGMGAEEIYAVIAQEEKKRPGQHKQESGPGDGKPGKGKGGKGDKGSRGGESFDPGRCGGVIDAAPSHAPAKRAEAEAEWETRVRQAVSVAAAANAGSIPGDLARIADNLNKPKIDTRGILLRFIDEQATRDYSWARPNRRMLALGHFLPGYTKENVGSIGVVIDTSGSCTNQMLGIFSDVLQQAQDEDMCDEITVVYCDAAVQGVDVFERGDEIKLHLKGGGGTRADPAFTWFNENKPDVRAVIYFTDLEIYSYGPEPDYPVMWLGYGSSSEHLATLGAKVPFGEFVEIKV